MLQIFCTNGWRAHSSFVDTSCRYITKYLAMLETPLHLIQNQEMSINTIINVRDIVSESYQILHLLLYDSWDWILSKISIIIWWSKLQCSGKAWRDILHWRCRWCAASRCPTAWVPLSMGVRIVSILDECEGLPWQVGSYSDWWEKPDRHLHQYPFSHWPRWSGCSIAWTAGLSHMGCEWVATKGTAGEGVLYTIC